MSTLKDTFKKWYTAEFDKLFNELKSEEDKELLRALFPATELSALKHLEGNTFSLLQKIKWYYFLLLKSDEYIHIEASDIKDVEVLLWPTQQKHYFIQLPVYRQLMNAGVKVSFISGTEIVQQDFIKDGVKFVPLHSSKRFKNRFAQIIQNLKIVSQTKKNSSFKKETKNIVFTDVINYALTYREPYDKAIKVFNEVLKKSKVKFILNGYCFSTISLAIDKKCRENGIATGALQMGRMMYYLFPYSKLDVLYAYGKKETETIRIEKPDVEVVESGSLKIEVTENAPGLPEVESLISNIPAEYKHIGLVAFSGPGLTVSTDSHIKNLSFLKQMADKNPETYFIIKFHGKDNLDYYTDFKQNENVLVIDQNHPIFQFDIMHLIKKCDFLITGASTTLMEAAYWLKPVISVDSSGELQQIEILKESFVYKCRNFEQLDAAVSSINHATEDHGLKMQKMEAYINFAFTKGEKPASLRVAQDIQNRI